MAAVTELVNESFPSIGQEVLHYVNGVLDDASEFESSDDLYDAIGVVLQSADDSKTEEEIKSICDRLHRLLHGSSTIEATDSHRILSAPVQLSSLATGGKEVAHSSIWITRKENASVVDQKKLEKAEAMIKPENGQSVASANQLINRKDAKFDASGSNRSYDIRMEDFEVSFGERTLITGATVQLLAGRRYGFVGRNGLGKTTLLKMIAGRQLHIPSHIRILHVEQEVDGDDTPAVQSVLQCDERRENLLKEERDLTLLLQSTSPTNADNQMSSRLTEIYTQLESMESDKAPAKAAVILAGLGFTTEMQKMCTREFSGGWRMRLALARALFAKPDLLLLDEPTNMLDMKAIIWLENYLQTWATTILVVSHDRQFLNAVATDVLHLHSQKIDTYRGNYELFHKTREEKLKNQQKEFEAQQQYREHIQIFIDRFRYNANRASQVQSKLKLLEKLPELRPVEKETDVIMKFPECEKLSPPILQLDELYFYYKKDHVVFKNICVNASMDSRICIVGENGAGKTTLLKILLGDLDPVQGLRHCHRNLRIGYFSQHHVDQLDMNVTSVELLAERFPGKPIESYRAALGSYGVSGDLALRPVATLSGGQKSRVAFAVLNMSSPNFLVLDEPTNHLDMETIEALGKALTKFQGGVILVSHDERLIRMICKELWVVKDRTIVSLDGGFDEYKKIIETELETQGAF
ncbi:hypothetical protein ScPMuIL_009498 [Solemya velum]